MQRGIRSEKPPTLMQFQSTIAERWGDFDCLRGWIPTMDCFEHEMRMCISDEGAPENLVNALMFLSSLASMASVDLSRGSIAPPKKDKGAPTHGSSPWGKPRQTPPSAEQQGASPAHASFRDILKRDTPPFKLSANSA